MTQQPHSPQSPYALGHTPAELERLDAQTRYFGSLTLHVLQLAGIAPGMRVLDVGCGAGGTSFLAAQLVGPHGLILGVDKSPAAIATAAAKAAAAGMSNMRFITADLMGDPGENLGKILGGSSDDALVDAMIGTRVLLYFPNPALLLQRLLPLVRSGGIVAFQEYDLYGAKSEPRCALFELSLQRMNQAFARAGADNSAGLKLAKIFEEAGLPSPEMIQGARVEKGENAGAYEQLAEVVRSLLPLMERFGVATAAEVDVDTLAARLRQEVVAHNATMVAPPMIGAWTRKE
jgi:ubiquinone/menaquinone biosynthesis C-methylase UbiE